jgi:uncharacterized protein involved in outer membrane biogenesis
MKKPVKILLLVAILPVFLVLTVVGLVYKNQDFIVQQAIEKINKEFEGKLELEDSHVAPFANFPYLSIDLENVKFYESKAKDTTPLYEASDFYLGFNLLDLIRGIYHIEKIKVQSGHLDVIRYPNGDINLLLAKGMKKNLMTL